MILADTSAWVEYDRATGSAVHLRMRNLIDESGALATTEPVIAEFAIGARDDRREAQLRRLLGSVRLVPFRVPHDYDAAVRVYRSCRSSGVTPRGLIDCMVAAVALRSGAAVLARDGDYEGIASVTGLRLALSPGR